MSEEIDTTPEILVVARVLHEANRAWCEAHGDQSQPSFEDADDWMVRATLAGIRHRLANPEGDSRQQHDAWLREKAASGWRYGEVKDTAAKTHPMMVDYDALPEMEKRKDALFMGIVDALLSPID